MFGLPPILAHLVELITVVLISGIGLGLGLRLLALLRVSSLLSIGERLVFGLALGYAMLAYALLTLGLLGLIYLPIALILLLLLAVLAAPHLWSVMCEAGPSLRRALTTLRYPPNLFLALIIILAIAVALVQALVPPLTQDDVMYHLALPARYVAQHAVRFQPDFGYYSTYPQMMGMLCTWGLLLGSDRLAVLLVFACSLLGVAAVGLFAKRYLADGRRDGRVLPLLTVAILFTSPVIGYILRAANDDLAQAGFALLAVYACYCAFRLGNGMPPPALLALAGLCGGLALAVKYTAVAVVVALGVALVVVLLRHGARRWGQIVKMLAAFGLPLVLVFSPWLLRNYLETGNPVWPFAGNLFGGSYWSAHDSPTYLLAIAPPLSLQTLADGWSDTLAALTRPPLTIDAQVHVVSLGPLLLPLLLALPLARWRPPLGWLGWVAAGYWLCWATLFSHLSIRYLAPFFLLAALLGAYAAISLAANRWLRPLIGGLLALTLVLLTLDYVLSAADYLPTAFATDRPAEQDYLARHSEDYPMMQYIAASTPLTATVYVWDSLPRGYYIPRRYIYARLVPLYSDFGGEAGRWRARLAELGVDYVLYHPRLPLAPKLPYGYDPYKDAEQTFMNRYFGPPLFTVGDYALYKLR